jgi:hypothetical protein
MHRGRNLAVALKGTSIRQVPLWRQSMGARWSECFSRLDYCRERLEFATQKDEACIHDGISFPISATANPSRESLLERALSSGASRL